MARPVLKSVSVLALLLAGATACRTAGMPSDVPPGKYPRRGAGCDLTLYHTAVPGAAAWDDLGIAEVGCHVTMPIGQCLAMLKAEGCRLGGDMLYNVPHSPLRPSDQVMVFRGQVAHTRAGVTKKDEDADLPAPASAAEQAQPVVPLTGAGPATPGLPELPPAPDPTAPPPSPK